MSRCVYCLTSLSFKDVTCTKCGRRQFPDVWDRKKFGFSQQIRRMKGKGGVSGGQTDKLVGGRINLPAKDKYADIRANVHLMVARAMHWR